MAALPSALSGSKNIELGDVYACGAQEPDLDLDNMFDLTEPPDPQYDLSLAVTGEVAVKLNNAFVRGVVGLGAMGGTSVEFSSEFPNTYLSLLGIKKSCREVRRAGAHAAYKRE